MGTSRLEAFSDAVVAILLTIMVLGLHAPAELSLATLIKMTPVLTSYAFSFLVLAIMWINHHHLLQAAPKVDARVLWSNILWLFWLSLIPFATVNLGEHSTLPLAVAVYGAVLGLAGLAFALLRQEVNRLLNDQVELRAYNRRMLNKSILSALLYCLSVPLAFASIYASFVIFLLIPVVFFLPERKLAQVAEETEAHVAEVHSPEPEPDAEEPTESS